MREIVKNNAWAARLIWGLIILALVLTAMFIAARLILRSEWGLNQIETHIEAMAPAGQSVQIDGMSGDIFGQLQIDRITVSDGTAVWLRVDNAALDWSPQALFRRSLRIKTLSAQFIQIDRKPYIETRERDSELSGLIGPRRYYFDAVDIGKLTVSGDVMSQETSITLGGSAYYTPKASALKLNAKTLETMARDIVKIDLNYDPENLLRGQADIYSAPNGLLSELLKIGADAPLRLIVKTQGSASELATRITGKIGEKNFLESVIMNVGDSANIEAQADIAAIPLLSKYDAALGGPLDISANIDQMTAKRQITGTLSAPNLTVGIEALKSDAAYKATRLTARIRNPLSILDDASAKIEALSFDGRMTLDETFTIQGQFGASGIKFNQYAISSLSGPVEISKARREIIFGASLTEPSAAGASEGVSFQTILNGRYDLDSQNLSLSKTNIALPGLRVSLSGSAALKALSADLTGNFNIEKDNFISVIPADINGVFALSGAREALALTVNGTANVPQETHDLIGELLRYDADLSLNSNNDITMSRASIQGNKLSITGTGSYSSGGQITADVEYAAEPTSYGAASLSELTGRGELSGRLEALNFNAAGQMDQIILTSQPQDARKINRVNFTMKGNKTQDQLFANMRLTAESEYGPISGSAKATQQGGLWSLSDIDAQLSGVTMNGNLSGAGAQFESLTGQINIQGDPSFILPADRLELTAALSNTALDLNAKIGAATLGPLSEGDITLTASGPRNAIAFNLDISGQTEIANMNRPAILAVNGSADLTAQNMSLQTDIKAKLGRQVFTTNNPLIMTQIDGGWMTDVNMSLLGGVLKAELNSAQNLLSLRAQSLSLPSIMSILGRPAIDGELSFKSNLSNANGTINGDLDAALSGLIQPGGDSPPVSGSLSAQINNNALILRAQSQSDVLNAATELSGELTPIKTVPFVQWPPSRPLMGTAEASGDFGPLAELFLPPETDISGVINLSSAYTLPLDSAALKGRLNLQDGVFEQGFIGLKLKEIDMEAEFSGDAITVSSLTANGASGGTLTGAGRMEIGFSAGSAVTIAARNLKIFDRREGAGTVSGNLKLTDADDKLTLGGTLKIDKANINIDKFPRAGRPTLEVDFREQGASKEKKAPRTNTALDIIIMSAGKIGLSGYGVNASMALDSTLSGPFNAPVLGGSASITRGRFDILSKRFTFGDSRVTFSDDISQSRLALLAVRETNDITAKLSVSGTISRPDIALSTESDLPEDEVLSRILFGRSPSQLSTFETARLAAALAQLSGGSGFNLLGGVQGSLGLDTLDIGQNIGGNTQLTTGKYLSENVYVEVKSSVEGAPGLGIEWTPRNNISVEAETTPGDTQRLAVQWKKDFD